MRLISKPLKSPPPLSIKNIRLHEDIETRHDNPRYRPVTNLGGGPGGGDVEYKSGGCPSYHNAFCSGQRALYNTVNRCFNLLHRTYTNYKIREMEPCQTRRLQHNFQSSSRSGSGSSGAAAATYGHHQHGGSMGQHGGSMGAAAAAAWAEASATATSAAAISDVPHACIFLAGVDLKPCMP